MPAPSPARIKDDKLIANLAPAEQDVDLWEFEPPASWKVPGRDIIYFPVTKISTSGGLRIQRRARPGRRGVRVTTTGVNERVFNVEILLENDMEEADEFNTVLYPDTLQALVDSFEQEETGDLVLPMRGLHRCKCESYVITEENPDRNSARLDVTWVQDNEEEVDQASFARGSARSSGRRLAEQARFSEEEASTWSNPLAQVNEYVSELEGIMALPETTAQDITSRARIIRSAARRAADAFTYGADESRQILLDPFGIRVLRRLIEIEDMAGRAEGEALAGRPKTTSYFVQRDRSLQSIALELQQDYGALLDLNQWRVEDPALIPEASVIRVFEVT